jgi:hypothetical protein
MNTEGAGLLLRRNPAGALALLIALQIGTGLL